MQYQREDEFLVIFHEKYSYFLNFVIEILNLIFFELLNAKVLWTTERERQSKILNAERLNWIYFLNGNKPAILYINYLSFNTNFLGATVLEVELQRATS